MKKIFSHPFILSLLIIGGFIFLNSQGWLKVPQDAFFRLIGSGQRITYQLSLKANSFIDFLVSVNKVNQENIKLREENVELLSKLAQLNEIAQENEFLRQQMELSIPEAKELILANVIGQDPVSFGKYFLINKGERDGVREKATVITAGNLLVGQVIEVTDSFSKVQLIIDSNSRINARLQGSTVTGLVKGDQGLDLLFDLLPQGEIIERGDMVVTSGLAGLFPSGLLIGQIKKVISSDVQISQMAEIEPAVDFQILEKVFVIKE